MADALPAISGHDLISLLLKDGWVEKRRNDHAVILRKRFSDRTRVTIVQDISESLKAGTLSAILGTKQTNIGKDGLRELLTKY